MTMREYLWTQYVSPLLQFVCALAWLALAWFGVCLWWAE